MRSFLRTVSVAALLGTLLCAGEAGAQPGWVDPPSKAAKPAPEAAAPKPAASKPAAPQAASPESEPAPRRRAERRRSARTERAERRRAQAHHAPIRHAPSRRLAETPAPPPAMAAPAADARFGEWAETAQRLADDYVDSVSGTGAGLATTAPRFYAEQVRFHGRVMSLPALVAEKRRFARRWPDRRYELQPGTMRTACNGAAATCVVRAVFSFQARNPATGALSQGVSDLTLEVSFAGGRPVIVSESSRVLRRGAAYSAAPSAAGRA
ncbi:hypothetical protein [Methylobacterium durans]|uniref:DUF4440 domain-containing protein n=1 Tax=Methylobacterium durans TaxID=2202825 RepID=A0A2U8W5U8_9HYPH|nr:hypothetical protein [Methylobacterium durans]AWN41018.1 hypothetical protein DK389_11380 [Methylobacterium durans]